MARTWPSAALGDGIFMVARAGRDANDVGWARPDHLLGSVALEPS
ncbi:hypothetical protein [Nonomuraea dietziae]